MRKLHVYIILSIFNFIWYISKCQTTNTWLSDPSIIISQQETMLCKGDASFRSQKPTLQFVLFSFQPLIFTPVQQHHSALLDAADHKAQLGHRGVAACQAMYSDHPIWKVVRRRDPGSPCQRVIGVIGVTPITETKRKVFWVPWNHSQVRWARICRIVIMVIGFVPKIWGCGTLSLHALFMAYKWVAPS